MVNILEEMPWYNIHGDEMVTLNDILKVLVQNYNPYQNENEKKKKKKKNIFGSYITSNNSHFLAMVIIELLTKGNERMLSHVI
jgi:hypothetical protein